MSGKDSGERPPSGNGPAKAKRRPAKAGPVTPPCPLTGGRTHLVQRISVSLIVDLWRIMARVDVAEHYRGRDHIHLYRSDCGLHFFHPMIPGSPAFYAALYRRWDGHGILERGVADRAEYLAAARLVGPGDRVLDVGCGRGGFASHLGHADFTGVEPYAPADADPRVLRETVSEHRARGEGRYDVVTAFQVIEHVADPRAFVCDLVALARPGGLVVIGAPAHPSVLTEIPNNLVNAPPHHLTWWNEEAFAALASLFALEVVENTILPASPYQSRIGWIDRFLPVRAGGAAGPPYFAHRWAWHAGLAVAAPLAMLADRLLGPPKNARGFDAFLVARKPL